MRRLEYLVTKVRQSTDNADVNGISNNEIVEYFNDGQKYIETLIFKNNPYADLFKVQQVYAAVSTGVYDLPEDCYSENAISMVEGRYNTANNNEGYSRIKPIAESEFAYMFGYTIRNNQVLISGQNNIAQLNNVRVTYFKHLKTLDIRRGTVGVVVANTSIAITSLDTTAPLRDDNYSTCSDRGVQVVGGIYSASTASPLLTTTTTGVIAGQFLLTGGNATNVSELPDACEPYLIDYVRQRIYTRNNYEDAGKQMYFTEQQKQEVISIFSKNKKDDDTVPITDYGFLTF
jgi:hypothetical protein